MPEKSRRLERLDPNSELYDPTRMAFTPDQIVINKKDEDDNEDE